MRFGAFFLFENRAVRCGAVFTFFKIIRCGAVWIIFFENGAVRCGAVIR